MKKLVFLLLGLTLMFPVLSPALAIMPFAPERTIGLHLGAKNQTFDESKYPDIDFYYLPKVKWSYNKASGTPEVVVSWLEKKGLSLNEMVLLDKNGIVDFTGFLAPGKKVTEVHDLGFLYTLEERLKRLVEEGREAKKVSDKPMKWDWVSDLEGHKFPSFEVVTSTGEVTTTSAIIGRDDKPKLMIVFMIPYNYKFQDVEKHMEDVADPLQALSAIAQMETGDSHTAYLKSIEEELYNR
ncbi:MAG: hypothetical protein PHH14_05880 [Candidatus Margulisbacteria bacterium]|nr:hypothetical protein [Candidatus Margulisiibacteriota bacterium]